MIALPSEVDLLLALLGLALVAAGAWSLRNWLVGRHYGTLEYADTGDRIDRALRAPRYRLSGRPDELRRLPDGRRVPVEWKSTAGPPRGPHPSHRAQVLAYCLLVEEASGRAPPFGVLRYSDGAEYRIPWDGSTREEVLRLLREVRRPYDGRATPTAGKCARCRWAAGCDARIDRAA